MKEFMTKYAAQIKGAVSGFDRLVFRGTFRSLCYAQGMKAYLQHAHVLLKDFGRHAQEVSTRVKDAAVSWAVDAGRPVRYMASPQISKEQTAQAIAEQDGVHEGPVCALTCVEPCTTFDVYRNRNEKRLQLVARLRKCLFVYHYFIHPEFGFCYVRLQTWFRFACRWDSMDGCGWRGNWMGLGWIIFERTTAFHG